MPGYKRWDKFLNVINKAKESCKNNKHNIDDHFSHVGKMVNIGSKTKREIEDIALTRYACYLTAQNGDPRKIEISFAQNYFAEQTRKFELIVSRVEKYERLDAREKLKITEHRLKQKGIERNDFINFLMKRRV